MNYENDERNTAVPIMTRVKMFFLRVFVVIGVVLVVMAIIRRIIG